jgi:hypothetical protein
MLVTPKNGTACLTFMVMPFAVMSVAVMSFAVGWFASVMIHLTETANSQKPMANSQ